MSDSGKWFGEAMVRLRDAYGGAWWGSDSEWRRRLASYWDQLRHERQGDILEAVRRAPKPDWYPDRFPTAGQLGRVVDAVRMERAERERASASKRLEAEELHAERERRKRIPFTPEGQAAYVSEAEDPWEQLARLWECESVRRRIDPGEPTPGDMHSRRMRDFWALWNGRVERIEAAA